MTILALDIGDKRIGIAVSDSNEKLSLPLLVIHRGKLDTDCAKIQSIIEQYQARLIVAGLPKTLDGNIGPQAEKVQSFVDYLKKKISIPIDYWNEWFTTKEAESVMISANVRRNKRKEHIDKLAATLILEGYLRFQQQKQPDSPNPTTG